MATPQQPYSIATFFPRELSNHLIFKNNMKNLYTYLDEYIQVADQLSFAKKTMEMLCFASERCEQSMVVSALKGKMKIIEHSMNAGLAPYKWKFVKGIDTFLDDMNVKADYALFLE